MCRDCSSPCGGSIVGPFCPLLIFPLTLFLWPIVEEVPSLLDLPGVPLLRSPSSYLYPMSLPPTSTVLPLLFTFNARRWSFRRIYSLGLMDFRRVSPIIRRIAVSFPPTSRSPGVPFSPPPLASLVGTLPLCPQGAEEACWVFSRHHGRFSVTLFFPSKPICTPVGPRTSAWSLTTRRFTAPYQPPPSIQHLVPLTPSAGDFPLLLACF